MKKSPNRFRLPIQKLSWLADFRIQRRLKKAAAAQNDSFSLNRFMTPGYAFATLSAAVVTLGLFSQTWAPDYLASLESSEERMELGQSEDLDVQLMRASNQAALKNEMSADLAATSSVRLAEPMMAKSQMVNDSPFPETREVPLALDSYMITEEDSMADEVEGVFALGLQEIVIARLGYGGGFNYGATFRFTGAHDTIAVLDGNHESYDQLLEDVLTYMQQIFDLDLDPEILAEYLTGELPDSENEIDLLERYQEVYDVTETDE